MIDTESETWRDVMAALDAETQLTMNQLVSPALDFPTTQFVRGKLHALTHLAALPERQNSAPLKLDTEDYFR